MGFLNKIFKPVSKVLDKIIPNEIKPALPYLAAFAPMFGPTSAMMGSGIMQRALLSGGMNIAGQLAQEGNEGDINLLSAGLGALSGAMSAPGRSPTVGQGVPGADFTGADFGFEVAGNTAASGTPSAGEFFRNLSKGAEGSGVMASGQRFLGDTLAKGSDMYAAGLKEGLFSKAGAKAAILPGATATGDLMFAQAKRDQDAYEDAQAADSEADAASAARRAAAIRQSMEAYGFTDEEIEDAIYAAGYKTGGRVGLEFGGIPAALENIEDDEMKDTAKFVSAMDDMDIPIMDIVEEFEIQFKRKPNSLEEIKEFYKDRYDYKGPADTRIKETMEESFREIAAEGGRIGLREGGVLAQILPQASQITTLTPRPSLGGFQPLQQAQAVFPRLNELEQGVNIAENKLTSIRDRLGNERGTLASMAFQRPLGLQPAFQPLSMLNLNRGSGISALQSGPEAQGMKDGGMMNLGGKEMDLRGGGFVPIGKKEKADDVPARLSKNEFVMTADAVRAAGGGSVNEGAKRMYETMNKLEAKA